MTEQPRSIVVRYGNTCVQCGREIEASFQLPRETLRAPDEIEVDCDCDMGYPTVVLYRRVRRPPVPPWKLIRLEQEDPELSPQPPMREYKPEDFG